MKPLNKSKLFFLIVSFLIPFFSIQANANEDTALTIDQLLAGYPAVHDPLVVDNLSKAQDGAKIFGGLIGQWLTQNPNEAQKANVEALDKANQNLMMAEDIDDTRKAFITLSQAMITIIKSDNTLQTKWQLFFCPMVAKNQGFWVQPMNQKLANPYMGSAMPGCGSKKPWTLIEE